MLTGKLKSIGKPFYKPGETRTQQNLEKLFGNANKKLIKLSTITF